MSTADMQMAELDFQIADNWKLTEENECLREQNAALRQQLTDVTESMGRVEEMRAKLLKENVKLSRKIRDLENDEWAEGFRDGCEAVSIMTMEGHKVYMDEIAELHETLRDIADHIKSDDGFGIDRGWVLERIHKTGFEAPE